MELGTRLKAYDKYTDKNGRTLGYTLGDTEKGDMRIDMPSKRIKELMKSGRITVVNLYITPSNRLMYKDEDKSKVREYTLTKKDVKDIKGTAGDNLNWIFKTTGEANKNFQEIALDVRKNRGILGVSIPIRIMYCKNNKKFLLIKIEDMLYIYVDTDKLIIPKELGL